MTSRRSTLARYVRSPRHIPWLLAPVLAASVAGSLLTAGSAATASRTPPKSTAPAVVPASHRLTATPVGPSYRPLPRGRSATLGRVPFAAAPPRRLKHGVVIPAGATDGVPAVAIAAYEHAQGVLAFTDPGCHVTWEDVAGIGRVESDNGQTWGSAARVTSNGTLFPPIFGIPLNGQNGTPAMRAAGGGWIRAEGPMQFLPATWAEYAQDGNGDGQKNPQNFYDAALTTGVFLCANGGNLKGAAGLRAAILAYNHSTSYLSLVESWISFYEDVGVRALRAAGSGLLPTGTLRAETRSGPTAAADVIAAASASQATGSYKFGLRTYAGPKLIATGNGGVDTRHGTAWLLLQIPGTGALQLRLVDGEAYASLPPALASLVGAQGPWIVLTPGVLSNLPAPFVSGLRLASTDLRWIVGQLSGAFDVRVIGHGRRDGARATLYAGRTSLVLASTRLAGSAADLGRVATLVGSSRLAMEAWVSARRVRTAVLSLGRLVAGVGPITLHISLTGYGSAVTVTAPPVNPVSTTTTTTTTTTTSPTTTTLPPPPP